MTILLAISIAAMTASALTIAVWLFRAGSAGWEAWKKSGAAVRMTERGA